MDSNVTQIAGPIADAAQESADAMTAKPGGRTTLAEPTILCALATRPMHGYDLKQAVFEMTGGFLSLDPPGIYRMLRHLEAGGLVESSWAPGDSGPQRREYVLTDAGRALLADWRQFLPRQRQACLLTTDAIDAALGAAEQNAERADPATSGAAVSGGGA